MSSSVSQAPAGDLPPRWGVQASLIQPNRPAYWLFVVLLAIGGYLFLDEQALFTRLPTALAVSWLLVLVYAVPVFVIVYRLDLFEREPPIFLAAALIWGGVIAVSLAGYANDAWLSVLGKLTPPDFTAAWGAAVVAPVTEETLKLCGVIILFLIVPSEFDGVLDGFVYGALIGLGFTVTEDVSYFIRSAVAFGGADQYGPVMDTFLIRVVAGGLYGHVLFAGLTGTGFAYFVTRRSETLRRRTLVMVFLIAAGVAAHFVWDSPWMASILATASRSDSPSTVQWIEYGAVKGLPFLLLLVAMVVLASRSEERSFRAIIADEPDPAILTPSEIASLGSLWSRRAARDAAGRSKGRPAARLTGQLQSAQIGYAMIRSRTGRLDDPALEAQRDRIRALRAQLEALPTLTGRTAPAASPAVHQAGAAFPADQASTAARSAAAPAVTPMSPAAFAPAWAPTHLVPPGGMAAWEIPDPSRPPAHFLAERLELVVEQRAGAWAQVRAVNGWRGWVDGRLLVERRR